MVRPDNLAVRSSRSTKTSRNAFASWRRSPCVKVSRCASVAAAVAVPRRVSGRKNRRAVMAANTDVLPRPRARAGNGVGRHQVGRRKPKGVLRHAGCRRRRGCRRAASTPTRPPQEVPTHCTPGGSSSCPSRLRPWSRRGRRRGLEVQLHVAAPGAEGLDPEAGLGDERRAAGSGAAQQHVDTLVYDGLEGVSPQLDVVGSAEDDRAAGTGGVALDAPVVLTHSWPGGPLRQGSLVTEHRKHVGCGTLDDDALASLHQSSPSAGGRSCTVFVTGLARGCSCAHGVPGGSASHAASDRRSD